MPKSILITREIPEIAVRMLRDKGYAIDVGDSGEPLSQKKVISLLKKKQYDAVISLLTDAIDARVFDAAPSVKMYANYATGFDNIDVAEAKKRGISVSNAPADLSTEAVAEHTIALMFALAARIVEADESVRRGKYKGWSPMHFIGMDVIGKTIGLVGAGRIGERVACYARGMGMNVIYTDVNRNDRIEKQYGAVFCDSVDSLLSKADIVSLHVPLLDSTRHLMDERRLKLMKPTGFLINTSRGPIIDEKALEKALREKTIAGAALDVFEFEPKTVPGLVKLQNVILTPHIASASVAARDQMAQVAAQNVIDFLEGRKPQNLVNP